MLLTDQNKTDDNLCAEFKFQHRSHHQIIDCHEEAVGLYLFMETRKANVKSFLAVNELLACGTAI